MNKTVSDPKKRLEAYHDWINNKIRNTDQTIFEGGKFVFSVSSLSIGFLIAILEFKDAKNSDYLFFLIALILFVVSTSIAAFICIPSVTNQLEGEKIEDLHIKQTERYRAMLFYWGFCWFFGIFFSLIWLVRSNFG